MKRKQLFKTLAIGLAISVAIGITALALSGYGTSDDPLVTLSYVNNTLTNDLLEKVRGEITEKTVKLQQQVDDAIKKTESNNSSKFTVVNLKAGQTLLGRTGVEIILRKGKATCVTSSTGLLNVSSGEIVKNTTQLDVNNLYMAVNENDGLEISSDAVILVRGAYTIS